LASLPAFAAAPLLKVFVVEDAEEEEEVADADVESSVCAVFCLTGGVCLPGASFLDEERLAWKEPRELLPLLLPLPLLLLLLLLRF
jgi:hypothetical protein